MLMKLTTGVDFLNLYDSKNYKKFARFKQNFSNYKTV